MSSDSQAKPLLTASIRHRMGAASLDVSFSLTSPWTVLFGPSGSGKTTVLRAIAGFVRPETGRITYLNQVLADSASAAFLPPHRRPIRTAAQTPRLFPHMTVLANTLYGSGWTSKPRDAMDIAGQVLELFRLKELEHRMPRELSGGETQRASVARAIVSATTFAGPCQPLLLLDEPFSGLDATLRDVLLTDLQRWLARWKIPVLLVTHDTGEAFQLGAEVIRIADGKVVRQGPVEEVLAEERRRLLEQLQSIPSPNPFPKVSS